MKTTLILLIVFFSLASNGQNQNSEFEKEIIFQEFQPVPLLDTEIRRLNSKIVEGMEYKLFISLPENYETSAESYPVVYFLDAWAQFGIVRQAYWLLRFVNEVPPLIIVGIAFEGDTQDFLYNRSRDYTPTYVPSENLGKNKPYVPTSGGAENFAKFIETELFPFIEKEYRAKNTDRAIFGTCFGGLFGTYALFKHPELFQRYFFASPALWWDNGVIFTYENKYAEKNDSLPVKVFFTIGGNEEVMGRAQRKFLEQISSHNYKGLQLESTILENETHMSVIPAAHTRALRVLYNME